MKASELRIGNFVIQGGEITRVEQLKRSIDDWDKTNHMRTMDCDPIPLTEEWLLKLGAKKDKIDNTYYLSELEIMLPNFFRYKTSIISRIDYVHQLQNLYFVLTGEELKQQEQ